MGTKWVQTQYVGGGIFWVQTQFIGGTFWVQTQNVGTKRKTLKPLKCLASPDLPL